MSCTTQEIKVQFNFSRKVYNDAFTIVMTSMTTLIETVDHGKATSLDIYHQTT